MHFQRRAVWIALKRSEVSCRKMFQYSQEVPIMIETSIFLLLFCVAVMRGTSLTDAFGLTTNLRLAIAISCQ